MRKAYIVASLALLVVVAAILTQVPVSKPPLADGRHSTSLIALSRSKGGSDKQVSQVARQQFVETYGRLPLAFEANHGQTDASVRFLSRGNGYTLFLTANEAVLALRKSEPRAQASDGLNPSRDREGAGHPQITPIVISGTVRSFPSVKSAQSADDHAVLRLKLVGANPNAEVLGEDDLPGKSNYFLGNDPSKWRTNVPTYAKVRYKNVYPGIDLVYYGEPAPIPNRGQRQLEYDFVVAPGADPRAIRFAIPSRDNQSRDRKRAANQRRDSNGAVPLRIDGQGDLVLEAEGSEVRMRKPVVYQEVGGVRQMVDGHYVQKSKEEVGFAVGSYDPGRPLIIDPVLVYSTYLGGSTYPLGGSGNEFGSGIAVDSSGNAYVTGWTESANFPTANGFQGVEGSTYGRDAFVSKLNPAGSALLYSTYLGGSCGDSGFGIAVDSSGNAYVTGSTCSTNFPTANAFQAAYGGGSVYGGDAFVTKLNAAGSALVYSTYLGGSGDEYDISYGLPGIAVDSSGNAYVTGTTYSSNFPTANAFQAASRGTNDAFVTKLNASGSVVYSTYLGGSSNDSGQGIAVDSSGNAYVTGRTGSAGFTDFPTTANAFQAACGFNPCPSAFVTKLNAAGSALVYSTYLGGSGGDIATGIAVDSSGNAYVTGETQSTNFPTANAFQSAKGSTGYYDAFVTKLNAAGSALVYSTYLGGSGGDIATGIAVDSTGNAYVTGTTTSTNFPTANAFQSAFGGTQIAFVTRLNAAGSALVYSTYLGGSSDDSGQGIAVDSSGNAYVTGWTRSKNFPTASPLQPDLGGPLDAFVAKIAPTGSGCVPRVIPNEALHGSEGGTGTFEVKGPGTCPWTAVSNASWITITSGSAGQGDGAVSYSIATNPSVSNRTGTLTVAGDTFTVTQLSVPVINTGGVVNGATFRPGVAPGAIISIFGTSLAASFQSAASLPLPRTLANRRVTMDGIEAPLFYVSPNQINAQAPFELEGRSTVNLQVLGGASPASISVALSPAAPAVFTHTDYYYNPDTDEYDPVTVPAILPNPAARNVAITIFCTGLGDVINRPASGAAASANPLSTTTAIPTVTIGGIQARVTFSGLAPGFVGLYQVNADVPQNAPTGSAVPVVLTIGGATSNTVTIAVQ